MQLAGTHWTRLCVGANKAIDEPLMKPHRLVRRIQGDGMLLHAWRAEIIAPTADSDDQRVVTEGAGRGNLTTLRVEAGREEYLLLIAIKAYHLADAVAEIMPVRLRQVVHGMVADIHAASCHLMQERFPDMGPGALDERHLCFFMSTKPVSQLSHKLQPCRTAANNHNLMGRRLHTGL
jgi:hypothetical protein